MISGAGRNPCGSSVDRVQHAHHFARGGVAAGRASQPADSSHDVVEPCHAQRETNDQLDPRSTRRREQARPNTERGSHRHKYGPVMRMGDPTEGRQCCLSSR